MKTKSTILLFAMLLTLSSVFARGKNNNRFIMMNVDTTIYVGDTLLIDVKSNLSGGLSDGSDFNLSVFPQNLGTFSGKTFTAGKAGFGVINVLYADVREFIKINVIDTTVVNPDRDRDGDGVEDRDSVVHIRPQLRILPNDTLVTKGSFVDFKVQMQKDTNVWVDIDAQWRVEGKRIGNINSDGQLEVTGSGIGFVIAKTDFGRIMTRVISQYTPVADTANLNTIRVVRVLHNGKLLPVQKVKEGGKITIGGLPSPLNLLNGAKIYFPIGSLHENIELRIKLPSFAKVDSGKYVRYDKNVLNAVTFEVYVNNEHVHPYYFDIPLNVTIPYKKALIEKMGLDPAKLSLYYANDSIDLDSAGVSNIVVDTLSNQIYSDVAHFSNVVLTERTQTVSVTNIPSLSETDVEVYPNPVVENLTINLKDIETEGTSIVVTNIFGQTVLSTSATSSVMELNLSNLSSGIYNLQVLDKQRKLLSNSKILKK